MTRERFDVVVLGAGSAGLAHAFRAARHGAKVALLEPGELGGTCVNVGCVPKKAMWIAAHLAEMQSFARDAGFASTPGPLDWPAFVSRRQAYIERIRIDYREQLAEAGIALIGEAGHFVDAHSIDTPACQLEGRHIVIATGARPRHPHVPGAELGIDSDGFFDLRAAPRRVAIVGGGYVAVELAGVLRALGVEVDLVVCGSRLLDRFDADVVDVLTEHMRTRGISIAFDRDVVAVQASARASLQLIFAHGEHGADIDTLIWAIGRTANIDSLDLEKAGVALDASGHVAADAWQNTNVEGVHAIGDVTGQLALTPVATAAARHLADRLFGGQVDARLDYENVPTVIFASEPLASVGLAEADARARHGEAVRVYQTRFTPMLDSLLGRHQRTFMKLVCVGDEERIVGIHMIGRSADEILQGFAVALKLGARKKDLEASVAIHPTSAEELVLMR